MLADTTGNKFSQKIQDAVNIGMHILKDSTSTLPNKDCNCPLIFSFRHILVLLLGIRFLVKEDSIEPCRPLLRGILESYFGIEYILEKDTERRSMAFMVCNVHYGIKMYKSYDSSTEQGKALLKDLEVSGFTKPQQIPGLKQKIINLESLLKNAVYAEAESEYQRLRELNKKCKSRKSQLQWYSFYGGPKNVKELADHIKQSAIYHLYRTWSGSTHGTDIIKFVDDGYIHGLLAELPNDIDEVFFVSFFAIFLADRAYNLVARQILPKKESEYRDKMSKVKDFWQMPKSNL